MTDKKVVSLVPQVTTSAETRKQWKNVAENDKMIYDAYVEAGWTDQQATHICTAFITKRYSMMLHAAGIMGDD